MIDETHEPSQDETVGTETSADAGLLDSLQERLLELERTIAERDATIIALQSAPTPDPIVEASETDAILAKAGVGSTFTKEKNGWRISFVTQGDIAIQVSGATMAEALVSHGVHITHDSLGTEHAASDGPQHLTVTE